MNSRFVLVSSAAVLIALAPRPQAAITSSTFDGATDTPGTASHTGTNVLDPNVVNEGGNNFLRLLHDQGSQHTHYAFNSTHDANWSTITGQFDFRLNDSGGNSADGFGFLLIPQSTGGTTGPGLVPAGFIAEEPNIAGTLAIGLDMYPHPAANDISLHWNGFEQTNVFNAPASIVDFVNTGWHQAKVTYTQVGNGLNATVQVTTNLNGTPTTFTRIDQAVDARPYANRVQFSGRTGGEAMGADIDNVSVDYTGTAANLPTVNAGTRVLQDFDSLGASAYVARLHTPDGAILRQGPKLVGSGGSGGGAYMQLVPDAQNGSISSLTFNRTTDGGLAPTRLVEMDFRMANPDNVTAADGMGILLLPTSGFNIAGAGPNVAFENANVTNALSIGLRVYDGGPVNRIQLHWNNAEVGRLDIPTETLNLQGNEWNRLHLETEMVEGGTNVTLSVIRDVNGAATSVPVFTDHFVPGMLPYDYRIQTGTRTGGLNLQADVDNIRTLAKPTSYAGVNGGTLQNFDTPGTFYQVADRHGISAGSDGTRHSAILTGGPSGNFLRLAHAVNGQNPSIGFDQTIPSGTAKPFIDAEFDFRMTGQAAGAERADGFSFGLFGVSTYGTTGPLVDGDMLWEAPLLANALTLGFRIYDANAASSTDYITLNWNGTNVFSIDTAAYPELWDLNNDVFHHAKLSLRDVGTDTLASLVLTQDEFGNPSDLPIFQDVTISGLDLDSFDFRAGFGARTGGLNADMDLDNVQVNVPEPGSTLLLLGGMALLTSRRRRK